MAKLTEEQKAEKMKAKVRVAAEKAAVKEAKALAKIQAHLEDARVKVQEEVGKLTISNIEKAIGKGSTEIQILSKLEAAIGMLIKALHEEIGYPA